MIFKLWLDVRPLIKYRSTHHCLLLIRMGAVNLHHTKSPMDPQPRIHRTGYCNIYTVLENLASLDWTPTQRHTTWPRKLQLQRLDRRRCRPVASRGDWSDDWFKRWFRVTNKHASNAALRRAGDTVAGLLRGGRFDNGVGDGGRGWI